MTYGYEEALARRAASARPVLAGGSSYFAKRDQGLDPALFEHNDHLRDNVRRVVLDTFYRWCSSARLMGPQEWSQLWIAGSGITTAWNADRESSGEPGDLDTLIGIDYYLLTSRNLNYRGSRPADIAGYLNQWMHDTLWPDTSHQQINGSVYELTYYINQGVGAGPNDLLAINPYAAYNVTQDAWTLHPVQVPAGFSADYFSTADRQQVERDLTLAKGVLAEFQHWRDSTNSADSASQRMLAMQQLHDAVRRGAAGYDEIHTGRKAAFTPNGQGYFDPANFRWQAAKGNGAMTVLRALKQLDEQAHRDQHLPCDNIDHLLLVAALANGGVG